MAASVPTTHRFTVAEWEELEGLGVFGDARMELLDGEIVDLEPVEARHAAAIRACHDLLVAGVGDTAVVRVQLPLVLDGRSRPRPDLAVVRPPSSRYRDAHPEPADTLLVVEVADASLPYDLDRKAPRYAAAGIPECWVVDLDAGEVLVCADPAPGGYRHQGVGRPGDKLNLRALPEVAVPVEVALGDA